MNRKQSTSPALIFFSMLNYEIISLLIIHAAGARYCHLALKNVNKNMAAGMMSVFVEL